MQRPLEVRIVAEITKVLRLISDTEEEVRFGWRSDSGVRTEKRLDERGTAALISNDVDRSVVAPRAVLVRSTLRWPHPRRRILVPRSGLSRRGAGVPVASPSSAGV